MFVVDFQRHNDGESGLVGPFDSREAAEAFITRDGRCDEWSIVRPVKPDVDRPVQ